MILNIDYLWAHSSCPSVHKVLLEYSDMKLETHSNCEKGSTGHIQASKGQLLFIFFFISFSNLICFMLFNKYDYDYAGDDINTLCLSLSNM